MKRLVCEMCGSSDIIKKDGFYVCDTCGTKYSLEEAKKLFVEVSGGTVTVSNNPQEKNLEKLAAEAYKSRNWKAAEDFANQVLAINDKNFEAWEIKAVAISRQGGMFSTRIKESLMTLANAYDCKSDEEKETYREHLFGHFENLIMPEYKERIRVFQNCANGSNVLFDFVKGVHEQGKNTLVKIGFSESDAEDKFYELLNEMILLGYEAMKPTWESGAKKYYKNDFKNLGANWKRNTVDIGGDVCFDEDDRPNKIDFDLFLSVIDGVISLGETLTELINPNTDADLILNLLREMIRIDETAFSVVSFTTYWPAFGGSSKRWMVEYVLSDSAKAERNKQIQKWKNDIVSVENALKAEKERMQKEANDKYWSEHPEQKAELQNKVEVVKNDISILEQKIKELTNKRNEINSETFVYSKQSEIDQLNKKKQELEKELASTSIFKAKERKEIKQKIEHTNYSLRVAEDKCSAEQRSFTFKIIDERAAVDKELDPLKKELDRKKAELNQLNNELTKNH